MSSTIISGRRGTYGFRAAAGHFELGERSVRWTSKRREAFGRALCCAQEAASHGLNERLDNSCRSKYGGARYTRSIRRYGTR